MRGGGRLIMALIVAVISLIGYWGSRSQNPVTGQVQHVSLGPQDEIALGRKAAPELEQQYGGPSSNERGRALVDQVGQQIAAHSDAARTPYQFQFHLLADRDTINAFALPGGQVFVTEALAHRLHTEGELAGVLGHEIGHVVARHSAEHLAKAQLLQGLGGAAVIAGSDPDHPGRSQANYLLAQAITSLINLKFSRQDELDADHLGVKYMGEAGYDPRSMLKVMQVLQEASQGHSRPDFLSTHPNPGNRMEQIRAAIQKEYPQGVPPGLQQ